MYACVDSGAIPNDKPPIAGAPPASCPAFECYKVYIERKDVSKTDSSHRALPIFARPGRPRLYDARHEKCAL